MTPRHFAWLDTMSSWPPRRRRTLAFVIAVLQVFSITAASPEQDEGAPALDGFRRGIAQYLALHRRLELSVPAVSRPTDAANVHVVPAALRDGLKRARAGAPEGRIFTPRAAAVLKRLIADTVHGDYAALMRATHEDRDELGRALVNDRWPGTALTTMPPDLLAVLPALPPELQFRFVHRDLVLWDVRADLIVDVLRNAIPLETPSPVSLERRREPTLK